jgi:hypothetical protein
VFTDNMTWRDDVAQSSDRTKPQDGRPATPLWPAGQGLESFRNPSSTHVNLSRQEGYRMWERRCCHKIWPPSQVKWPAGLTSRPPKPQFQPRHRINPPINTPMLPLAKSVNKVRFSSPQGASKFNLCRVEREVRF